jgi:S-adenosyl methyltransferase
VSDGDQLHERGTAEKDLIGAVDTTVPVSARIWNYWLGGKDYYQVDKEAGDQFLALYPGIAHVARAGRLFISRTVTYLVRDAGVRQFLDIGTGLPTEDNTHEVAQRIAPECRVVYADNDPLVLAHARALLTGTLPGTTAPRRVVSRPPARHPRVRRRRAQAVTRDRRSVGFAGRC